MMRRSLLGRFALPKLDSTARAPTSHQGFASARRGAKADAAAAMRLASGKGVYEADTGRDMPIEKLKHRFTTSQRGFNNEAPEWALWFRENFFGLFWWFLFIHQVVAWSIVALRKAGHVDLAEWEAAVNDRWLLDDYVNFTNHPSRDLWLWGDEGAAGRGRITVVLRKEILSAWRDAMAAALPLVVMASPFLVGAFPYVWFVFGRPVLPRWVVDRAEARLKQFRTRPRASDKNEGWFMG